MWCLSVLAHPSLLPPGAWAVSEVAFWLQWLWLCPVPVSGTGTHCDGSKGTHGSLQGLGVSTHSLAAENLHQTCSLCTPGGLRAYFGFLDKSREGRRYFLFLLTCLPVISVNKFGHVPRLSAQLLNTGRNQPLKAFELSHHSHFTHTSKSRVCVWH